MFVLFVKNVAEIMPKGDGKCENRNEPLVLKEYLHAENEKVDKSLKRER